MNFTVIVRSIPPLPQRLKPNAMSAGKFRECQYFTEIQQTED